MSPNTCEGFFGDLIDWMSNPDALPPDWPEFLRHLAVCPECRYHLRHFFNNIVGIGLPSCVECHRRMPKFLAGGLSYQSTLEVVNHLAHCSACQVKFTHATPSLTPVLLGFRDLGYGRFRWTPAISIDPVSVPLGYGHEFFEGPRAIQCYIGWVEKDGRYSVISWASDRNNPLASVVIALRQGLIVQGMKLINRGNPHSALFLDLAPGNYTLDIVIGNVLFEFELVIAS